MTGSDVTSTKLDLKYNLLAGCTSLKRYSIYLLAKMWPQNIVKFIENILEDITKNQTLQTITIDQGIDAKTKLVYEVKAELQLLKRKQQLTKAAINTILNKYQCQLQEFGVKIVPSNEENVPPQTLIASQISFNHIPNDADVSYEKMSNFIQENPERLNYLIPDVSLHEDSQLFRSQPSYLSSQGEPNVNFSLSSHQTNKFNLSPVQNVFVSTQPQFFLDANKKPSRNFFTEEPFFPRNSSAHFFVNPSTPMYEQEATPPLCETIDGTPQSFVSMNQSKLNLEAGTPLETFKTPLSDQSISYSPLCSLPETSSSSFAEKRRQGVPGKLKNFFADLQPEEPFFVNPPTPMYGRKCTPNKTIDSAPQKSSFVSMNQSKFNLGLLQHEARTSTPLQTFKTPLVDYSISYSPLCPSPAPATSSSSSSAKYRPSKTPKFIPPSRLTKRQIQEEFAEQNLKMMSSDSSKVSEYARQICSRPSVRQLQQSEHIASIRRTVEGVVVIPAKENKTRHNKRKFAFNMPYKKVFDVNLLSDGNEKKFMEFLESGKRNDDLSFIWEEENSE